MKRRLVAILAADVVGYSKLMGGDELGTLAALRNLRNELFGPTVAGNHGKIVKDMGDGWLVEFSSVNDAVNCAMRVQDQLESHDIIKLRVGVHIGDVVHEDNDVFGDGVNIAARLQELSQPGAVTISDAAHSSLDGTLSPSFDDLGVSELKNISKPIRLWSRTGVSAGASRNVFGRDGLTGDAGPPSLAVLPISTASGNEELRLLADALCDDFVTYLNASHWLAAVISEDPRNRSYTLRSSLRARGSQLRLDVQLAGQEGAPIWKGKFDGNLEGSFEWQDATAESVTSDVMGQILAAEEQRLAGKTSEQLSATECCLSASFLQVKYGVDRRQAVDKLVLAITKDPNHFYAYNMLVGEIRTLIAQGHQKEIEDLLPAFPDWVRRAKELAVPGSASELLLNWSEAQHLGNMENARAPVTAALRKYPFDASVLGLAGFVYVFLGEPEVASECFLKAERYGRYIQTAPVHRAGHAIALVEQGRYEAAIEKVSSVIREAPGLTVSYRVEAASWANLENLEMASVAINKLLELVPEETVSFIKDRNGFVENEATMRYFDGLRRAGLPA